MIAKISVYLLILLYCAKWRCALSLTYENDQLDDIRKALTSISKDVQGITKRIDSLETDLERNLSNQIEESKREIVKILKEQRRDIEFFQNFNRTEDERNIATKNQDGGCGGVVIGDGGFISFSPQSFGNRTGEFRCIWTVRANRFEKVAFKLISGSIHLSTNASLSLSALKTMNKHNVTFEEYRDDSRKILGNHLYIMGGPVVFVTFISTYNSVPTNFILKYEGRGGNTSAEINYRHYHYGELAGEIDYPRLRDAETYSPNEIVTFVINPQNSTKFYLNLLYIDLQTSSFCEYDALSIFLPTLTFYTQWGIIAQNRRYCEKDSKLTNYKAGSKPTDAFIVTFKSDGSSQETGFRLSWPYPV